MASNTNADIEKLVSAVHRLMARNDGGWVRWSLVARECHGSAEYEPVCIGLAALPAFKRYFLIGDKVVKLSEEGLALCSAKTEKKLTVMEQAVSGLTSYAARMRPIRIEICGISRCAGDAGRNVYALTLDMLEEGVPSETPVTFHSKHGSSTRGKIVGHEPDGSILYGAFDGSIFETDLPGSLNIDKAFLLTQLARRFEGMDKVPRLYAPLMQSSMPSTGTVADKESCTVCERLFNLKTPWAHFLWGPPGAGKTYGLGYLAVRLMLEKPHERILVVAPSNRAVDVFVEQLLIRGLNKKLQVLLDTRKILRYGYPRKRSVIDRPELLGPPGLDLLSAQVRQAAKSIERAERQKASAAELAVLRSSMLELQEQVKQAVHDHVAGCTLVATTVTLAYLANSPIHGSSWNTVIVDEATMVAPVMQLFLSSLATDRFLVAGDPRQLGPVYESRSQASTAASMSVDHDYTWMGRDIFDLCGVVAGSGIDRTISTSDNRMVRITGQRRCAPDIWSRVSSLYPTVSLMSDEERSEWIRNLPPYPGKEIVILDTGASGTQSRCTNEHGSWKNQFSADLAMEVACMLAAETERDLSIAIITPYRAQVRLLRKAITQEQRATRLDGKELLIESGTVHQFQGSDADVVLFDLVDGFGHHGLGKLLQGDNGVRLATVAITRAKGKLIVLADRTWCADPRNFERATNPVLWDLIVKAPSSEILPVIPFPQFTVDKRRAKTESPIETALYDEMMLHADMEDLVAQHPIHDQNGLLVSRADFAFPELKLAIFCDGRHWHLREDRWQRDIRQRNHLAELGWTFLVFTGKEIIRDPSGCVAVIQATRSMLDKQHGPRNKT